MASKTDRLKARLKNVSDGTKKVALNTLRTGETFVAAAGTAYASGRMSDDQGNWGFRGVPYPYIGAGLFILSGLYASAVHRSDYGADLMALGTGMGVAHLSRTMYESGVRAKENRTTGGSAMKRRVPMVGGRPPVSSGVPSQQRKFGTIFDEAQVRA